MNKISGKINTSKIDQSALYPGRNWNYLDVILIPTPNSQHGDDYMIVQKLPKERFEAGEKGEILGNARIFANQRPSEQVERQQQRPPARPASPPASQQTPIDPDDDDIPF